MSEHLYLLTICLPLAGILLVFGMRYYSAVEQARARFAHDDAYRRMAEQAVTAEADTAAALSAIQSALSDLTGRMTSVEKILKDVG
jgi:hypothetical protein